MDEGRKKKEERRGEEEHHASPLCSDTRRYVCVSRGDGAGVMVHHLVLETLGGGCLVAVFV